MNPKCLKLKTWCLWLAVLASGAGAGCVSRPPAAVEVTRNLEYGSPGGHPLRLDIYRPRQRHGELPVILWLYGGAWREGSKDFCPIAFMATQQVAIVSINYRLTEIAPFPAQIFDCKGAVRWLRAHAAAYDLDPGHIGVFGVSAGGHLAALLGTTADHPELEGDVGGNLDCSSRVQCVCAFYPPTDLNRLVSDPKDRADPHGDVARLLGGPVADHVREANAASPLFYVSHDSAPFFLMHGGADRLVPPSQSEWLYQALLQAGVAVRMEIIPNAGHGIIAPPRVAAEIYQFFGRYLSGPKAKPTPEGVGRLD